MKKRLQLIVLTCGLAVSHLGFARNVFVNGVDASSMRNQKLEHVTIRIDENGDIFIDAPNYRVFEEQSYLPLSQWIQGVNKPAHSAKMEELPGVETPQSSAIPVPVSNPNPPSAEKMGLGKPGTKAPEKPAETKTE